MIINFAKIDRYKMLIQFLQLFNKILTIDSIIIASMEPLFLRGNRANWMFQERIIWK